MEDAAVNNKPEQPPSAVLAESILLPSLSLPLRTSLDFSIACLRWRATSMATRKKKRSLNGHFADWSIGDG